MKHLHFFGCSLTAGDELTDDIFFPWKDECKSGAEYFQRRNKVLLDETTSFAYEEQNLKFAYPALIEDSEYKTFNHAKNGASLKENIVNIVDLIFNDKDVSVIFLQIPPPGRELYFMGQPPVTVTTLRLLDQNTNLAIRRYIESKLISHHPAQLSAEDLIDLIMLANLAKQKNVRLYIINLTNALKLRLNDVLDQKVCGFINHNLTKELNLIDFENRQDIRINQTLGGHFNKLAHQIIAEEIKQMLPDILNIQA